MKYLLIVLLSGMLFSFYPQNINVENAVQNPGIFDWWGTNVVVNNYEPLGKMSGVQNSDSTLYVVVNDTLATANLGIIVYTSTNAGLSWDLYPTGINYRDHVQNLKMVRSPQDSIYVFFNNYSVITCWNVLTGSLNQFTNYPAGYRDFDVVCSSTGSLYLMVDLLANNDIRMFGSINGGFSWTYSVFLSSTGAAIKGSLSATGDTILINYHGVALQPDTSLSAIRSVRYRETTPGTLAVTGSFLTVIPSDGQQRKQFKSASGNGEAWLVYTLGPDSARAIYGMKSTDAGVTFSTPQLISINSNTNNYYLDVKYVYDTGSGNPGFALIYYSDSLQFGVPSNESDKLMYSTASYGGTFSTPTQISNTPPAFSDRMYLPQLITMPYNDNDLGVLWVGENSAERKLYWDRLRAIIPVELVSFTGAVSGKNVDLLWTTATEMNNRGFEVERNISGLWQVITFVNGNGTTVVTHNYSFRDELANTATGQIRYRLKQIDYDGTYEYSNVIEVDFRGIDDYTLEQNYPNPFNPTTTISYVLKEKATAKLILLNAIGEEIAVLINEEQDQGFHKVEFNASTLASGVYFYRLQVGDPSTGSEHSCVQTRKMILLK